MLHKSPVKTVSVEVDIRDVLVWFRRKHFRTMGEKNNLHSLIKKKSRGKCLAGTLKRHDFKLLALWITHCTPLAGLDCVNGERFLCWTHQLACVSPQKVAKVNATSLHNICLKQCHTVRWRRALPRATLVFLVWGLTEEGEAFVLQLLSGPGPYISSLSSIDMLGLPFYNSYWMLRVHGRAIMNYLLNRGRFTDDWSICVVRTSIEE